MIDRLDLVPQLGDRAPPQHPEDGGIGPFPPGSLRTKFAFDQFSALDESLECARDHRDADAVPLRDFLRRERSMRARVTQHEIAERIFDRLQKSIGNALWQRDP